MGLRPNKQSALNVGATPLCRPLKAANRGRAAHRNGCGRRIAPPEGGAVNVFVESVKGVKAMFLLGVLLNSIITGTEREMVKNLMRAFHVHPIYWTILLLYYGVFIYAFAGAFYRDFQIRRSPEYREWLRRQRAERRRRKNGQLPPAKAGSLQERDVQVAKYR
jgi:hypothetical protein